MGSEANTLEFVATVLRRGAPGDRDTAAALLASLAWVSREIERTARKRRRPRRAVLAPPAEAGGAGAERPA